MAKKPKKPRVKSKKCKVPNCLACKFWPAIHPALHPAFSMYWVDSVTGEVMIATGLRALPTGEVVLIEEMELCDVECTCGNSSVHRPDLLNRGLTDRCPACAAEAASAAMN